MNIKQVWGMAGGFFIVFIVITLTNRPAVHSRERAQPTRPLHRANERAGSNQGVEDPATLPGLPRSFQRGMVLVCPGSDALTQSASDDAVAKIAQLGANWVAINVPLAQEAGTSNAVTADPQLTPTVASVAHAVDEAHKHRLRVMLRPLVVARDGTLREDFAPLDAGQWLSSYAVAIAPYLTVAKTTRIELVSLGSGYSRIEGATPWSGFIAEARDGFSGTLTYGAAHAAGAGGGGYQVVPFWSSLDYVGIEAFFPVAPGPGARMADFVAGWKVAASEVETWARTTGGGKQVVFTAVGLPALAGAGARPGRPDLAASPDPAAQEQDCKAFFQTMGAQPWLAGAFWYGWEARGPAAEGPANPYAVQNQPTLGVLQAAYGAGSAQQ